jgi:beta-glucosidase
MARAFPEGFLWGSAISAHQSEGNNTNTDWWEHEHAPDTNAAEPSGIACDSWNRFAEDWKLVADSGQNAVRFSIEWARIEPSPGEISREAIDHYREVIGTARDLGLTAFVTLHHFVNPRWFAERGGWTDDRSVELFARYARTVGEAMGDLLQVVNTINEPQIVAVIGHGIGYFPPRMTDMAAAHRVTANLVKAHAAAANAIRETTSAKVGLPLSIMDFVPGDDSAEARQLRDLVYHLMAGVWIDALADGRIRGLMVPEEEVPGLAGADDFVGVQYYTRIEIDADVLSKGMTSRPRPGDRVTQMGWVWHPEGLGRVLDDVARVGVPVYVTENGIATDDDAERIEYVTLHLEQVLEAIARGVDVRGYFYWSILDNFEWNEGYRPRFGLVAVDRETMRRTPKPSLEWYGSVARANALQDGEAVPRRS